MVPYPSHLHPHPPAPAIPHPLRPSRSSTPLICSDLAPLNFLRSPLEPGLGRPLQINLTETERPTSSHARSHSHDRCPHGAQRSRWVYTHVSARPQHRQPDLPLYVCHWAGTEAGPAYSSSPSFSAHTPPALWLPEGAQKCNRRRPHSRQPRPALPGRFAGLRGQ